MLDLNDIKEQANDAGGLVEKTYPPIVIGRIAHIDADFLAYHASYEHKNDPQSFENIMMKTDTMIDDKRRECAAEFVVLHLTPSDSNKAERFENAIQKKYQGNRDNSEKPRYLSAVREFMGNKSSKLIKGKMHYNAEADDGMAEAAWKAHVLGEANLCIIASKDKDLRIPPGLHLEWDTGVIEGADDTFGFIEIETTVKINAAGKKVTKHKPKGYGTKFFWWQMLMGDAADNIKGCPKVRWSKAKEHDEPLLKPCGIVSAYAIMEDVKSDKEALKLVAALYAQNKYVHWETGETVPWSDVFWSEAQLLWMQRTAGAVWDVKEWIKDIRNG